MVKGLVICSAMISIVFGCTSCANSSQCASSVASTKSLVDIHIKQRLFDDIHSGDNRRRVAAATEIFATFRISDCPDEWLSYAIYSLFGDDVRGRLEIWSPLCGYVGNKPFESIFIGENRDNMLKALMLLIRSDSRKEQRFVLSFISNTKPHYDPLLKELQLSLSGHNAQVGLTEETIDLIASYLTEDCGPSNKENHH